MNTKLESEQNLVAQLQKKIKELQVKLSRNNRRKFVSNLAYLETWTDPALCHLNAILTWTVTFINFLLAGNLNVFQKTIFVRFSKPASEKMGVGGRPYISESV